MNILVLSDIHGKKENLDCLKDEFKKADFVLFAGDFAEFQHPETAEGVLQKLSECHDNVFSVLGNCDEESFLEKIEQADISVEKSIAFFEGFSICGSGGGSKFTGTTPFEREDKDLAEDFSVLTSSLSQLKNDESGTPGLILIMHNPPFDTKCDVVGNGIHVGSKCLREVIEKTEPVLVVTGHIHESAAIDKIGETVVINPGSLAEGKYACVTAEKENGLWKITGSELKTL